MLSDEDFYDEQLGNRIRRAFKHEAPPATPLPHIRERAMGQPHGTRTSRSPDVHPESMPRLLPAYVPVPLLGRIAAGIPIIAEEQVEELIPLPLDLVGPGELFMLRVKGDSMVEAGVLDGAYVVVRSQPHADNGEMVAAMVHGMEDEATVKYFSRTSQGIRLLPANPAYRPIDGDRASFTILGVVVCVVRRPPFPGPPPRSNQDGRHEEDNQRRDGARLLGLPGPDDAWLRKLAGEVTGTGELHMLRVDGDSMYEAGVLDGDVVVVRAQPNAESGDIVAAMLPGEEDRLLVRFLAWEDGRVCLLPANSTYPPIDSDQVPVAILGVVVAILGRRRL
jgi:SOS regulatory protein LexA